MFSISISIIIGAHFISVDTRGRVLLPGSRFRKELAVRARDPATCKHGWSKHGFSRIPLKHPQIANSKHIYNNHVLM